MEHKEKELPDFKDEENVIRNSVIEVDGAFENARDYVRITQGNPCGNWGARSLHLISTSSDKQIGITIEIRWIYENRPRTESRVYNLYPGQQIELGCPIPGPTSQRFDYILIAAWFI